MAGSTTEKLDVAAQESLLFITKVFRGGVRMEERENRLLLGVASAVVGNWAKVRQSASAREATRFTMAAMLARDETGRVADMMHITMPENPVTKALPSLMELPSEAASG